MISSPLTNNNDDMGKVTNGIKTIFLTKEDNEWLQSGHDLKTQFMITRTITRI